MPKATKKSACETQNLPPEDLDVPDSQEESASSDQEPDAEISFHPSLEPLTYPVHQVMPSMYMPYIKGPKMDWTLNDGYTTTFLNGDWNVKTFLNASLQPSQRNNSARK